MLWILQSISYCNVKMVMAILHMTGNFLIVVFQFWQMRGTGRNENIDVYLMLRKLPWLIFGRCNSNGLSCWLANKFHILKFLTMSTIGMSFVKELWQTSLRLSHGKIKNGASSHILIPWLFVFLQTLWISSRLLLPTQKLMMNQWKSFFGKTHCRKDGMKNGKCKEMILLKEMPCHTWIGAAQKLKVSNPVFLCRRKSQLLLFWKKLERRSRKSTDGDLVLCVPLLWVL